VKEEEERGKMESGKWRIRDRRNREWRGEWRLGEGDKK
jgi:hypothetical protein